MIISKEEKERLVNNLTWMITDMKYKNDELKGSLEEGSQGDYSPELKTAISLLEDIEKTETIETTGCHRKSTELNCREFKCDYNKDGICTSTKATLEKIETPIIGMLRCVEAKNSEEEEKK